MSYTGTWCLCQTQPGGSKKAGHVHQAALFGLAATITNPKEERGGKKKEKKKKKKRRTTMQTQSNKEGILHVESNAEYVCL